MSRVLFTSLVVAIVSPAALRAAEPVTPVRGSQSQSPSGGVVIEGGGGVLLLPSPLLSGGTFSIAGPGRLFVQVPGAGGTVTPAGTYSGTITGTGGLTLTKSGSGLLFLGGGSTYTAPTTISAVTVQLLSGSNTYTGSTTISNGTLQLGNYCLGSGSGTVELGSGTFSGTLGTWGVDTDSSPKPGSVGVGGIAASAPAAPIPAGPVFYIITEGAGLGDSVRSVPCTGKETVMDAVGYVNGISQVSSLKIWIARPALAGRDKGATLPVDWDAISRRGINTTNYTLMPGDRFVVGEDPQVALSNLVNKKLAPVERLMGMVGLTCSTLNNWDNMPDADREALKGLVQRGVLTDDAGLKSILLEVARLHDLDRQNQKARPKEAEKSK